MGLVERSVDCGRKLVELYQDSDGEGERLRGRGRESVVAAGLRQEEVAVMGGPDEFAEFYRRLKHLKDNHRK